MWVHVETEHTESWLMCHSTICYLNNIAGVKFLNLLLYNFNLASNNKVKSSGICINKSYLPNSMHLLILIQSITYSSS